MSNAAEKLDPPQLAELSNNQHLVTLDEIEQGLEKLKETYGTVPNLATTDGYKQCKDALKELTRIRNQADNARLEATKPHREFVNQVNERGKSLVTSIGKIEKPLRDAKEEADSQAEREKQERIARLQERLDKEITAYLDTAVGLDSQGLADLLADAERIDTRDYFDLTKEAEDAKERVISRLREMWAQTKEREELDAEREALAREKEELNRQRAEMAPPDPEPESTAGATLDEIADADPFGEAFDDLVNAGFDPSVASEFLETVQDGRVRHVTFQGD